MPPEVKQIHFSAQTIRLPDNLLCFPAAQVQAMRSDPICPSVAGLLEAVLGSLRHECLSATGAKTAREPAQA